MIGKNEENILKFQRSDSSSDVSIADWELLDDDSSDSNSDCCSVSSDEDWMLLDSEIVDNIEKLCLVHPGDTEKSICSKCKCPSEESECLVCHTVCKNNGVDSTPQCEFKYRNEYNTQESTNGNGISTKNESANDEHSLVNENMPRPTHESRDEPITTSICHIHQQGDDNNCSHQNPYCQFKCYEENWSCPNIPQCEFPVIDLPKSIENAKDDNSNYFEAEQGNWENQEESSTNQRQSQYEVAAEINLFDIQSYDNFEEDFEEDVWHFTSEAKDELKTSFKCHLHWKEDLDCSYLNPNCQFKCKKEDWDCPNVPQCVFSKMDSTEVIRNINDNDNNGDNSEVGQEHWDDMCIEQSNKFPEERICLVHDSENEDWDCPNSWECKFTNEIRNDDITTFEAEQENWNYDCLEPIREFPEERICLVHNYKNEDWDCPNSWDCKFTNEVRNYPITTFNDKQKNCTYEHLEQNNIFSKERICLVHNWNFDNFNSDCPNSNECRLTNEVPDENITTLACHIHESGNNNDCSQYNPNCQFHCKEKDWDCPNDPQCAFPRINLEVLEDINDGGGVDFSTFQDEVECRNSTMDDANGNCLWEFNWNCEFNYGTGFRKIQNA